MKWLYFAGTATGDDNIGNIMILQFAVHVCFRCWLKVLKMRSACWPLLCFDKTLSIHWNMRDPSIHPFGCTVLMTLD